MALQWLAHSTEGGGTCSAPLPWLHRLEFPAEEREEGKEEPGGEEGEEEKEMAGWLNQKVAYVFDLLIDWLVDFCLVLSAFWLNVADLLLQIYQW